MKISTNTEHVIKPPRRIPHGIIDKVKQSLDSMQADGIIIKVTEPIEWVSLMVAAKKKNTEELCICIDPRDLYKALMGSNHPLKAIEEVASSIPNATVFSILDAMCTFWHIPLDRKSSYYTTFNTVFDRYRYLHMPYDLISSSKVYQQAIEQLLEGWPCKGIVDDVLVWH